MVQVDDTELMHEKINVPLHQDGLMYCFVLSGHVGQLKSEKRCGREEKLGGRCQGFKALSCFSSRKDLCGDAFFVCKAQ